MTLRTRAHCDGPGCRKSCAANVSGRRAGLAAGWFHDPGWGDWCSSECHEAWLKKRREAIAKGSR